MEQSVHNPLPSLLWPPGHDRAARSQGLSQQQAADLGLDLIVRELDWDGRHASHVRGALLALVADPDVIAYRQAVVAELLSNAPLRDAVAALLPGLGELARPRSGAWAQDSPLLLVPPRLSDLELYVACVNDLYTALNNMGDLHSAALQALHRYLETTRHDPQFQSLVAELPGLRAQLDQVGSVTVGVNLDQDLRPLSATLVSLNREQFSGPRSIAARLFGRMPPGIESMTALRQVAERNPEVDPLARDLEKVLAEVVQPVATGLERYHRIHARPMAALEPELAFYLGAVDFVQRLAAHGLPTCLPSISRHEHILDGAYNPALALQLVRTAHGNGASGSTSIIRNPIDFRPGRIVFLTGPNRGGKTTYLRAVGLNQLLFQAGLFVAAERAAIEPVDAVLTHFPLLEGTEPGHGRLDDEARRLRELFGVATRRSLLLFNEPLTSTSEHEAHRLASDVLRALQLLDARAVFVTHLHALAAELPTLNNTILGSTIVSWVAGVGDDATRTYLIRPGLPTAESHASTIARQHGITFEQLSQHLRERGLIAYDEAGTKHSPVERDNG